MNKVLIVDDEPEIRVRLAAMTRQMGFAPYVASSALSALKVYHNVLPGIIITDLNLGGEMDGISLCSKIRYENPKTCVIAVTGHMSEYELEFCLAAGFADVLTKPVDMDELYSSLQCNLERRTRWLRNGGRDNFKMQRMYGAA